MKRLHMSLLPHPSQHLRHDHFQTFFYGNTYYIIIYNLSILHKCYHVSDLLLGKKASCEQRRTQERGLTNQFQRVKSYPTAFAHLLCNQKEFRMKRRHPVFGVPRPSASQMHGLPKGQGGKESASQHRRHRRCSFNPWVKKMP